MVNGEGLKLGASSAVNAGLLVGVYKLESVLALKLLRLAEYRGSEDEGGN